jgi:hypothetical protein
MQAVEEIIRLIRGKNRMADDHIRLLKKNTGDPAARSLLEKHKEYSGYFKNHYTDSCLVAVPGHTG